MFSLVKTVLTMTSYARLCVHMDKTRGKVLGEKDSYFIRMVELPYSVART